MGWLACLFTRRIIKIWAEVADGAVGLGQGDGLGAGLDVEFCVVAEPPAASAYGFAAVLS